MKKLMLLSIVLFVATLSFAQSGETVNLKIKVDGMVKGKGDMRIALFDSEATYLEKASKQLIVDMTNFDGNVFEINDLQKGHYAISVIQDENKNGELDMGLMGPEEGYGFSNNVRGMFGPAPYHKAVMLVEKDMETTIKLH